MTKPSIPLGLVFSRTGPYAIMSGEMQKSALMAVDEVNQSEEFDFSFAPQWRDPGGVVACACRKSNSHIQMMKSAKKWLRQNATNGMHCSRRRRVLMSERCLRAAL
jgi:hypothetical protein